MPPGVPAAVASSSTMRALRLSSACSTDAQNLEGQGQQGVSGQNGHGFAEDFVAGGPAPAQVVVVQRGQVVMDQRVSVDQFQRAGGRHNTTQA